MATAVEFVREHEDGLKSISDRNNAVRILTRLQENGMKPKELILRAGYSPHSQFLTGWLLQKKGRR